VRARTTVRLLQALLVAACTSEPGTPPTGGHPPPSAAALPPLPIGLDAYRAWDRLYRPRIGARTYMRSTYDRAGGNEGVDASHFLRQEASDFHTTLDLVGPGVLYFVRTNHWHGSPWHYVVDGMDFLVRESSTLDPLNPVEGSTFLPEAAFPSPLTFTWSTTRGADLNWVPIAFDTSLTLAYSRTHYGTGYYIFQLFPRTISHLSRPLEPFRAQPPDADVLALLSRAGEDIGASGPDAVTQQLRFELPADGSVELAHVSGSRRIVALKLRIPREQAIALSRARLTVTWDDSDVPSIDAPVSLFFGSGSLFNRDAREWLVRGLMTNIRFGPDVVELASYFPMPFERTARIELHGAGTAGVGLEAEVRHVAHDDPPEWTTHFHATYLDHGEPVPGRDLVLLDTARTEGGGDYCGTFVGTSFIFSDRAVLWTLEGDPRFFFDDSESPQAYGTGTEEWAGGGDYWGGQNMTLPLAGHPVGAPNAGEARHPEDLIQSAYRVLIADAMPFGKNARIQLEHGGLNESTERYRTVTYWYGRRGACLVRTDGLHVGDIDDERAHDYVSPTASPVQTVTSRYELGVDHLGEQEIIPEHTDTGRKMTGVTEFSVALHPDNRGVLVRRKLDYGFPDQRADVFVSEDRAGAEFELAGTWYLAGSNRCVYSNPPGELDPPAPILQTSNRRFRDDEFLIGGELTRGLRRLRLRIVFRPLELPLAPGEPIAELAWSELRYSIYSWVLTN
jgi:hypothetical protein